MNVLLAVCGSIAIGPNIISMLRNISYINKIVGIETRGFILGAPLANALKCGFIPIRKKGKLPYKTYSESYKLEYGTDCLEVHTDALKDNENVVLIDDVLATGGTAKASIKLIKRFNVNLVECAFLIELLELKGNKKIFSENKKYHSIIKI